jgi:hypothetical protein
MRPLQIKFALILTVLPISALGQSLISTVRTSETSGGTGQNGGISVPTISPNGRFVAFTSTATNLVANDTNNKRDIFVKNLSTGVIKRVNFGASGVQADDDSFNVAVSLTSPNGFIAVAYESLATNIHRTKNAFPDANGVRDIFVSLPKRKFLTERVSIGFGGTDPDGQSNNPSLTIRAEPNRILVAYSSVATNLVEGDTNGKRDIFFAKIQEPAGDGSFDPLTDIVTTRISNGADNISEADDDSAAPQISGDGKFIVFESLATNLVSGVTPSTRQVYLYDEVNQTISLISKAADGTPGNGASTGAYVSFSGRYVVYMTNSNNIIGDGFTLPPNKPQVVRYDTVTGLSERVNTASDGTPSNGTVASNLTATISASGRFVTFSDNGTNIDPSDTNGVADVFAKDMETGVTLRVSQALGGGDADNVSFYGAFGQEGYAAETGLTSFASAATNLISNDSEGLNDTFVSQLSIPPLPLTQEAEIELPPDVLPVDDSSIGVTMQEFDGVLLPTAQTATDTPKVLEALGPAKVRYKIRSYREGPNSTKLDKFLKKTLNKNVVTLGNLSPGTHVIKYRAEIVRKRLNKGTFKVISQTPFSPIQRVTIGQ